MTDDELRKRFDELKRSDAKEAPPFERLVAKRPRARVPFVVALAPVLAAAAVFLVWCGTSLTANKSAHAPVSAAAPALRPLHVEAAAALPLDFLLENAPVGVHLDADPMQGLRP